MTSLALLLLVRSEGESYAAAGLVVAVYAVALGVGAPIGGRQVDRYGPTRVIQVRAVLFAAFLAVVVALAVADAGIAAIAAAAALAGFSMPPLSSTVRVVWPRLARDELRSTAYALEAIAAGGALHRRPARRRRARRDRAGRRSRRPGSRASSGRRWSRGFRPSARRRRPGPAAPACSGRSGRPACARSSSTRRSSAWRSAPSSSRCRRSRRSTGPRELGGVALACFSAGSLVGGLLAGLRPADSDLRRFVGGAFVLSGAMLALQLAVSIPTLCLLAFVAGLPIAPTIGALYTLIDRSARAGTVAEAFAWFGTAVSVGIAARVGGRRRARRRARRPLVVRARGRDRARRRRVRLGAPRHAAGPR